MLYYRIPKYFISALRELYNILSSNGCFWILIGSTSLRIQGVDVKLNDIDILTNKKGSIIIDKLLLQYRIKKTEYSTTDKYRSYYGIYQIGKIKIDVMGEFQYKMKDGSWSQPNQNHKIIYKEFEGMKLPLLTLKQELVECENMGKYDKVEKIRNTIAR